MRAILANFIPQRAERYPEHSCRVGAAAGLRYQRFDHKLAFNLRNRATDELPNRLGLLGGKFK